MGAAFGGQVLQGFDGIVVARDAEGAEDGLQVHGFGLAAPPRKGAASSSGRCVAERPMGCRPGRLDAALALLPMLASGAVQRLRHTALPGAFSIISVRARR